MYIINSKYQIGDKDKEEFTKVISSLTVPRRGQIREQIV